MKTASSLTDYLYEEGSKDDGAEDGVVEDAFKDVPLAVDLASIELVKDLHQDKGVEDDGVVLGGRGVEWCVSAAVDIKHLLTCGREKITYGLLSETLPSLYKFFSVHSEWKHDIWKSLSASQWKATENNVDLWL